MAAHDGWAHQPTDRPTRFRWLAEVPRVPHVAVAPPRVPAHLIYYDSAKHIFAID